MPKSRSARREFGPNWTVAGPDEVVLFLLEPTADSLLSSLDRIEKFYSFADICNEADWRARHLLGLGLKKATSLPLVVPDAEEFILTFIAATTVGIVPVPMYPPMSFGKLDSYVDTAENILGAADAKVLLTDARVQAILWSLVDKVPTLDRILTIDKLEGEAPTEVVKPEVQAEDTVFLQFTSGSTSLPKGVVVTHKTLAANLHAIMGPGLEMVPGEDVTVSWLPLPRYGPDRHDARAIGVGLQRCVYSGR